MDVVRDGVAAVCCRVGSSKTLSYIIFGNLDLLGCKLVIVISVKIKVGNDVSKIGHVLGAARLGGARAVRWPHVGGEFSENVGESHFVPHQLVISLSTADCAQILVRPGVGGNLMLLFNHPLDDVGPSFGRVDGTLVDVDTGHEEGGLCVLGLEKVQQFFSVNVWAIVVSEGNSAWLDATVDTLSTIYLVSKLGTGSVAGTTSTWYLVAVTAWAKLEVAVRRLAVLSRITAVSFK